MNCPVKSTWTETSAFTPSSHAPFSDNKHQVRKEGKRGNCVCVCLFVLVQEKGIPYSTVYIIVDLQ